MFSEIWATIWVTFFANAILNTFEQTFLLQILTDIQVVNLNFAKTISFFHAHTVELAEKKGLSQRESERATFSSL